MDSQFQSESGVIKWKAHFRSSPERVYGALASPNERAKYWADTVEERAGKLTYEFKSMGFRDEGRILKQVPQRLFSVEYLGTEVNFHLSADSTGGTDLELHVRNVPESRRTELIAGWVNFLMTMRGAVDFGIDLRNHDAERTWNKGYVEN